MDRAQKEQLVDELGQIFESSGVVVVSHYVGLTVAEMQDLRARARAAGGAVRVAKNRLAKIALEGKPCESIADLLTGMTVLTYSEDPVAAAKVAQEFSKENPKLVILGGSMGRTRWTPLVSKPCRKCLRGRSLSPPSRACSAHLLRTSPGPLAHLQATSHPSCPRSRTRRLRKAYRQAGARVEHARWNTHIVTERAKHG